MTEMIKTNGTRYPVQPANGTHFTLGELQTIVGGCIELVELDGDTTMVVNEEGKLIPLSFNLEASRIFWPITRRRKTSSSAMYSYATTIKSDKNYG